MAPKRQSDETAVEPSKKKKSKADEKIGKSADLESKTNKQGTDNTTKKCKINLINDDVECYLTIYNSFLANDNRKHGHGNLKCTKYFCAYCLTHENYSQTESFSGTIDNVYEHWLAKHSNESISQPFRFYAVPLVVCFHCECVGVYYDLVKHHAEKHLGHQFVVVKQRNNKKCGVCHFKDGNLLEHFQKEHKLDSVLKAAFNPLRYSEERINDLLKIDMNNSRSDQSKEVDVGNRNTPDHLICGYCLQKVDHTNLLKHFGEHKYNFKCSQSQCTYQSADLSELICHEHSVHAIDNVKTHYKDFPNWMRAKFSNTDIVFHNGLSLKMYNVHGTKFDENKLFDVSIDTFLDLKKKEAKNKMEQMNANTSKTSNCSTSQNETNSTAPAAPVEIPQNQRQSASNEQSSETTAGSVIKSQLIKQQQLAKNVYVQSIWTKFGVHRLKQLFLHLCFLLGVTVNLSDIQNITQLDHGIIVTFYQLKTKARIMRESSGKFIQVNELIQLTPDQIPWEVCIKNHMTPYYLAIHKCAEKLQTVNLLHSFCLLKDGFLVKVTAKGAKHIVQSKEQLMDLVKKS